MVGIQSSSEKWCKNHSDSKVGGYLVDVLVQQ